MTRQLVLAAMLVAVLSLTACGGEGSAGGNTAEEDAAAYGDTQCAETGDEEASPCTGGHYFKPGIGCVLITEPEPEVVAPCQCDPSLEGKDCGGCFLHCVQEQDCSYQCGQPPDGKVPPLFFEGATKADLQYACP